MEAAKQKLETSWESSRGRVKRHGREGTGFKEGGGESREREGRKEMWSVTGGEDECRRGV